MVIDIHNFMKSKTQTMKIEEDTCLPHLPLPCKLIISKIKETLQKKEKKTSKVRFLILGLVGMELLDLKRKWLEGFSWEVKRSFI